MNLRSIRYLPLIAVFLVFCSCGNKKVETAAAFAEWLNQEENGCKVTRQVNGMNVSVKFLPASFLALKEYETSGKKLNYDSLYKQYVYSATFLVSFLPADMEKGPDMMYSDVMNFREYVERSMELNFELEKKMRLATEAGEYSPVLSSLENTYGLSKGRDVYMVFSPAKEKQEFDRSSYFDFVYADDIYKLGTLHFVFDNKQITLPEVLLNKGVN